MRGWCTRDAGTLSEHWNRYVSSKPVKDCWKWQGSMDKDGYGKICHAGKHLRAHRVSYELHYSKIPYGKMICHSCDNPYCVNPKHLFIGSNRENMADMVQKNRGPLQKLSSSDVGVIRKNLSEGKSPQEIAVKFGVHPYTIRRIRSGKRWGHLEAAA